MYSSDTELKLTSDVHNKLYTNVVCLQCESVTQKKPFKDNLSSLTTATVMLMHTQTKHLSTHRQHKTHNTIHDTGHTSY